MTRRGIALLVVLLAGRRLPAQPADRGGAAGPTLSLGASVVAVAKHVSPGPLGRTHTEGYLTQPIITGVFDVPRAHLFGTLTADLEGLTLGRGELTIGAFGEGYVDRRHPHTYAHEAIVGLSGAIGRTSLSLAGGRGFAAFGSDDPMVRDLVGYPVNHHLAQILERLLVTAAVRRGPVIVEGSVFNGDEPVGPEALSNRERFGDSWSARVTVLARGGVELSASHARVASPEIAVGGGLDQRKWHASLRIAPCEEHEGMHRCAGLTRALVEWARTSEYDDDRHAVSLSTYLAEGTANAGRASVTVRLERTLRPEEPRTTNPFRTPWPPIDLHRDGVTRWTIASAQVALPLGIGTRVHLAPFVEASIGWPRADIPGALFDPVRFYGGSQVTSVAIGARAGVGHRHGRMGRYGAAGPG